MLGPIFAREWLTVPRRVGHYVTRSAYLGVLWVLGLTAWQATVGWSRTPTLGDTSRFGFLLFQGYTLVQLVLLLFFAALSSASAIIQEKDRRTFVLLLLTDLRNYEIVLGKVLGSVLQIGLLLAGMVPVLALLILLGGVSLEQVGQMMLVLAVTGLAAASLGGLVALWRDRTFQALALTVLFLVLYLCLVQDLAVFAAVAVAGVCAALAPQLGRLLGRANPGGAALAAAGVVVGLAGGAVVWYGLRTWEPFTQAEPVVQGWLDPYRAWKGVLAVGLEGQTETASAYSYAGAMLLVSVALNVWGVLMLRVWNPSGEPVMQREGAEAEAEEKDRLKAHAAPGAARPVWANPILWREVRTRAYGRWPLLVKAAYFLVLGLICWFALAPLALGQDRPLFAAAYGLVPVGILSLLLVSAQAVTAITSERDTGALDLLLVTDLTPKEFIFGKLLGICWNAKEYLLPPLLLACVYAWWGLLATPPRLHPELLGYRNGEALFCVLGVSLVLLTFALVLGVHVALRTEKSRLAIINTLGTVFFLSFGTLVCVGLILINGGRFEYQWLSFIFFIAAGISGLWWVLSGDRPSAALTLASWLCPPAVFYAVTNVVVGRPGSLETADPFIPFVVIAAAFGFTVLAMLVPLVSEFDVALGRTTGGAE